MRCYKPAIPHAWCKRSYVCVTGGGGRPEDGAVICRVDAHESSCCGASRFDAEARGDGRIASSCCHYSATDTAKQLRRQTNLSFCGTKCQCNPQSASSLLTFREILDEAVAVGACSKTDVSERVQCVGKGEEEVEKEAVTISEILPIPPSDNTHDPDAVSMWLPYSLRPLFRENETKSKFGCKKSA